jgi:hypothetical protein
VTFEINEHGGRRKVATFVRRGRDPRVKVVTFEIGDGDSGAKAGVFDLAAGLATGKVRTFARGYEGLHLKVSTFARGCGARIWKVVTLGKAFWATCHSRARRKARTKGVAGARSSSASEPCWLMRPFSRTMMRCTRRTTSLGSWAT